MKNHSITIDKSNPNPEKQTAKMVCPVCGAELFQEKCKVVCRSRTCVYRIIYNCSEF